VYGSGPTARIALGVSNTWGSGQIVQLSVDGGNTWREIEQGMPHTPAGSGVGGWVDDIEIDPSNPDHISHVHGGGIVETKNASANTPSWSGAVTNLEETATQALVTPPAGAPYKFVNSAGDIGTWLQTDLATAPTKGPSATWSNGNYADLLWSDPTFIVGAGVQNGSGTAFGFWSGDGGNTWSNFAKLPAGASTNKRPPTRYRRIPRTAAHAGRRRTCRRWPASAGIAATAWRPTARTRTRSMRTIRAAHSGARQARSMCRRMAATRSR
jgi:xyloglucan-specific exo-beta-1,4-glucanase